MEIRERPFCHHRMSSGSSAVTSAFKRNPGCIIIAGSVYVCVDAVKLDWRRFSARVERMWSEPSHCSTQEEEADSYTAT